MATLLKIVPSLRNLVVNGNLDWWQRGISATGLISTTAYLADRFLLRTTGTTAVYRMDRSTDVPTFAQSGFQSAYSLAIQPTTADAAVAAGDQVSVEHRIEGYDYAHIASGKAARLQFWAKSVLAGTYCLSFTNSAGDRCFIKEYVLAANTWTRISIDFNTDTSGIWLLDNGRGFLMRWSLMSGTTTQGAANVWQAGGLYATSNQANFSASTSNIFNIAQVALYQIEAGAGITLPFARAGRTIQQELAMCQRYYQILELTQYYFAFSSTATAGVARTNITFSEMRATPSTTPDATSVTLINVVANTSSVQTLTVQGLTKSSLGMFCTGVSNGIVYAFNGRVVACDAEL